MLKTLKQAHDTKYNVSDIYTIAYTPIYTYIRVTTLPSAPALSKYETTVGTPPKTIIAYSSSFSDI
jgi:hypothetical protein